MELGNDFALSRIFQTMANKIYLFLYFTVESELNMCICSLVPAHQNGSNLIDLEWVSECVTRDFATLLMSDMLCQCLQGIEYPDKVNVIFATNGPLTTKLYFFTHLPFHIIQRKCSPSIHRRKEFLP